MPDLIFSMNIAPIVLAAAGSAMWGMLAGSLVTAKRLRRREE
jgi:predicted benzoate:H+ symporter BenE